MERLILVNLKTYIDSQNEIDIYLKKVEKIKEKIIFFPSAIYLEKFVNHKFQCGIQNISNHEKGAYTGEISASSVKDMGVSYVLLGHSEIRGNLKETNEIINQKIKISLENNLKPVLCIGENIIEKNNHQTKEVLKRQIYESLKDIEKEVIISYEPVWAIGTGLIPQNKDLEEIINYIKSLFTYDIKVLYGGSVSEKNINTLSQIKNLDGFLIGSAAINPENLIKIEEVIL